MHVSTKIFVLDMKASCWNEYEKLSDSASYLEKKVGKNNNLHVPKK
jgi:hypothetical protein